MNDALFDAIARNVGAQATRRGLLRLLGALGGGLVLAAGDDVEGKNNEGRSRRHQARHRDQFDPRRRKGKGKGKKGGKKGCKPRPIASTCAGRCGRVQNNCNKPVDCGCCDNSACAGATPICVNSTCVACSRHDQCGPNAICLANGVCQACTVTCSGGTCPEDQLQAALNAGGTVFACPGRYTGTFNMPASVTLVGAGDGADSASNTILDAQHSGRTIVAFGGAMNLSRVRVTGGLNSGGFGAGIYHLGHTLTMTDCTVTGNRNTNVDGGGIYNQGNGTAGSALTMTRCKVTENNAANAGAGIYTIAALNLTNCQIEENTAGGDGGGIFVSGGSVTLDGCTITGNHASNAGGVRSNVVVTVRNGTTITGNIPNNCPGGAVPGCTG